MIRLDVNGQPVPMAVYDRGVLGSAAAQSMLEPAVLPTIAGARAAGVAVIVTVHNQMHVTRPCLRALHARTPLQAQIIIIDDASDAYTHQALLDEAKAMNAARMGRAVVSASTDNLRYTKSINRGLALAFGAQAPHPIEWAVCLNSDTLVTPGWLERILQTADAEPRAVLISPFISCVGDGQLDNPMQMSLPPGTSYMEAAERLAALRGAGVVDAVTPVGACMAVKRDVYEKIGGFDETIGALGGGYGDECDYWGRATKAPYGFRALKATSAYVWHQSHASYGANAKQYEQAGFNDFKARHWEWYEGKAAQARLTDPTRRISAALRTTRVRTTRPKVCFYAQALEICGGVLALWNIANGLNELGFDASVAYARDLRGVARHMPHSFGPMMVPEGPNGWANAGGFDSGILIATDWRTGGFVTDVAKRYPGIMPMAFVQDREDWFRTPMGDPAWHSPQEYAPYLAIAKRACVVNSRWVAASMVRDLGVPTTSQTWIPIGTDPDLFYDRGYRGNAERVRILSMSRPTTPRRGHSLMVEMYRRLWEKYGQRIELATYGQPSRVSLNQFPVLDLGTMPQGKLAAEMAKAHILLEPSLVQGYGMAASEIMSTGGVAVSTSNGGIDNFAVHNVNALIAKQHPDGSHDADDLFRLLCLAIDDAELRARLGKAARETIEKLSWVRVSQRWAETLQRALDRKERQNAA